MVNKSSTNLPGWGEGGAVTSVWWQITLCDSIDKWHPVLLRWISLRTICSFTFYLNPKIIEIQTFVSYSARGQKGCECLLVLLKYTNVLHGQTDGRTDNQSLSDSSAFSLLTGFSLVIESRWKFSNILLSFSRPLKSLIINMVLERLWKWHRVSWISLNF